MLKARIRASRCFREWKDQYILRFYYARNCSPACKLLFKRQRMNEKRALAKSERAARSAVKRMHLHQELEKAQDAKLGSELDPETFYQRFKDFLPWGGNQLKVDLMYQWKDEVRRSMSVEHYEIQQSPIAIVGDIQFDPSFGKPRATDACT